MGAALGGGKTNNKTIIKYSSLQVSTSLLDVPVALFWGQRRLSTNCIWYNNFKSHSQSGKGGKGGGNKSGQYTYTASVITALCEGEVATPLNVWGPSSTTTTTTLSALGAGIFATGTPSQSPWSFVTGEYPSQARSYMNTAYVGFETMNLGSSAAVPDYGYELQRLCGFTDTLTAAGWTNPTNHVNTPGIDCSFADIVPDFLTNEVYGMGLASTDIENTTAFRTYQDAQGLYFSPLLTSQEKATDILDRWAVLANTWIFWDGTQIRFVPLGDSQITGDGATYTPDLAPAYNLGIADFIGDVPVEVARQDPADCYNRTRLEIADRTRSYVATPYEYKDQYLVGKYGLRDNSTTQADEICNPAVAQICAQLIGKRAAYIRNTYKFKLSYRYILLLPGSIVTLTEPNIGLSNFPVRIRTVDEDDNGELSFLAEELPYGISTYYSNAAIVSTVATTQSTNVDPGSVNTPAVCEPASSFAQGQSVILIAASGGANWGGCIVNASLDGTDYSPIGTITARALQGTLTAALAAYSSTNPDTTNTLAVDATQSEGVYPAATDALAQNSVTLCWVAPQPTSSGGDEVLSNAGELLAFGAVSATGTYTANLTYLERGLYGTTPSAHGIGDQFTLFDISGELGTTVKFPLPANYIGKTIYLKFQSFNAFDQATQDLSTVTAYTFTPSGASFGAGSAGTPSEPTGFGAIVQSSQVILSWAANPPADNVASYAVYRAVGISQPFSSASLIWAGLATSFTDTNVNLVTGYTYYVVAINAVGDSLPSVGFNASTAGINNGQVLQSGSFSGAADGAIDFNPQVLACGMVEITLTNILATVGAASLKMRHRVSGADVASNTYQWSYMRGYPAGGGYSEFWGGAATNPDTSVELSNEFQATNAYAMAYVRLDVGNGISHFKCAGINNAGVIDNYDGAGFGQNGVTGVSFFFSSGNVSFDYQIKGY